MKSERVPKKKFRPTTTLRSDRESVSFLRALAIANNESARTLVSLWVAVTKERQNKKKQNQFFYIIKINFYKHVYSLKTNRLRSVEKKKTSESNLKTKQKGESEEEKRQTKKKSVKSESFKNIHTHRKEVQRAKHCDN